VLDYSFLSQKTGGIEILRDMIFSKPCCIDSKAGIEDFDPYMNTLPLDGVSMLEEKSKDFHDYRDGM